MIKRRQVKRKKKIKLTEKGWWGRRRMKRKTGSLYQATELALRTLTPPGFPI